jgi:hypothetical protein
MTAIELLQRMATTYANAAAYRDVGRVQILNLDSRSARTTRAELKTTFIRSKGFRFGYRELPLPTWVRDRATFWPFHLRVEQGKVVDYSHRTSVDENVGLAVAGLTGITFGAAHHVLRLLLPDEIPGRTLSAPHSAEVVRTYVDKGETLSELRLNREPGVRGENIVLDEAGVFRQLSTSGITPNPAKRDHLKSGQRIGERDRCSPLLVTGCG